jgi:asparagine synthase (glutamine-hydrolysing)
MCGITGLAYSDPKRPVNEAVVRRMAEMVRYRGPDSYGSYVAPGVGLGIRRLSIIDLQTGEQPIANEDGTVTIVCNGEIYNFVELRDQLLKSGHRFRTGSDVEVIVHLYEDFGVDCLHHLRGMFGFALWDARRRRLMLARDRLGIKPLHYAVSHDGLFFGSEYKSILVAADIDRTMDVRALKDIFTIGYVLAPKTLFGAIRQVLPGHYLLYQEGTVSTHQYWDAYFPGAGDEIPHRTADQWAEALKAKLEETVRIHLRSDVPVGAWLSAGIDSSAVVGLASRILNRPIQTFSLAFENPDFDEVSTQKVLADFPAFNLSNQRVVCRTEDVTLLPQAVWHGEDPRASGTEIPRLMLAHLAGQHVKVVLTGEGSDEVFGGYPWFTTEKLVKPLMRLPVGLRRLIARVPAIRKRWHRASRLLLAPDAMNLPRYVRLLDPTYAESFNDRFFSGDVRDAMARGADAEDVLIVPKDFERWHHFSQLQYVEMKVRLSDYINRYLDTTSMAYSQEARVPFLDHELVELCAQIPPALKMRGIREKYILRRAMREVLPPDIVQRPKRGLAAPSDQWMRNLPEFAVDLLSEESVKAKGYFDETQVRNMVEQHRAGTADYARRMMGMLEVHLWDDLLRRGCSSAPSS